MSHASKDASRDLLTESGWLGIAAKAAGLGVWHADPPSWEMSGDANLMRMLGVSADHVRLTAQEWQAAIHPDDRERVQKAFADCIEGRGPLGVEFRVLHPDGATRWITSHGDAVRASDQPLRIAGVSQDVTEQRRMVEAQQLLMNELNHRVRNTLTTVLSLARQTASNATDIKGFIDSFQARIMALSGAHSLLTRRQWEAVSLKDLIDEILAPRRTTGVFTIAGPDCDLSPRQGLALSLGLHELATNAGKYGALTTPTGRIEIIWEMGRESRRLRLTWAERGGPEVVPPKRQGFGTNLIQRALASDLDGEITLDFDPPGVRCTIDFPAGAREAKPAGA